MTQTNEVQIVAQEPARSQPLQSQPSQSQAASLDAARVLCLPPELGGRQDGLEPTRYGDWELRGRCIDF